MSDEITNLTEEEKEALGVEDQPEEANNTEEKEAEPEKTEEPKEEENEEESEKSEKSEEEEEIDDDIEDEEAPRNPQVPYKKFKEERDSRKKLEKDFESLKADMESLKTKPEDAEDIDKLADEYGVDSEFIKKLTANITSKVKSPISEEDLAEWREQRELKKQDDKFREELDALIEEKPDADKHRKELKKLAFNPKYSGKNFKSLFEIYIREIEPNVGKKKTIESGGKKTDTEVVDYDTISEADALDLPPEQFLKWTEYKATKS